MRRFVLPSVILTVLAGLVLAYAVVQADARGSSPAARASHTAASHPPHKKKPTPSPTPTPTPTLTGVPTAAHPCLGTAPPSRWAHVIWAVMENKPADRIMGASDAPYEN